MAFPQFDRSELIFKPLGERLNKKLVERDLVSPDQEAGPLDARSKALISECSERIVAARSAGRPVIMAFGAHAIKNGLGPVLIKLVEDGWVSHLATNGAGIIHDWEFAFQGMTSEDVGMNVRAGSFGLWQETGYFINLALNVGACEGKGYGESVGALIHNEKVTIPNIDSSPGGLARLVKDSPARAAAAVEMAGIVNAFNLAPGELKVPHPWKACSVQASAYRCAVPFTGHPMIGHDIIYCHPMNNGALLGKAALRDFLSFVESVSRMEDGVYLSVGSAVMSPMIFEKALSMARNRALGKGKPIGNHYIFVVDLSAANWDWSKGEPPEDDPAYYQRFNKTFSRMGGAHRYLSAHNRDFLLALYHSLSAV